MAKIQFETGRALEVAFAEFNKQRAMQDKPSISKKRFIELSLLVLYGKDTPSEGDALDVLSFIQEATTIQIQ